MVVASIGPVTVRAGRLTMAKSRGRTLSLSFRGCCMRSRPNIVAGYFGYGLSDGSNTRYLVDFQYVPVIVPVELMLRR